jgi:MinD superfamily P-loop ATPase
MREVVVISGKGGTGKTSITASFAALARKAVIADCDVDAADLHLVLRPQIENRRETFTSGRIAVIRTDDCIGCGLCRNLCRFDAIRQNKEYYVVDPFACEGCGVCVEFCPAKAIDFPEQVCGEWFVYTTPFGELVHARMRPGAENSGKLVSLVRQEARKIAERQQSDYLLVDGPPGIGCPVIASITGADLVLAVAEPTLSGEHDLQRIFQLAGHFGIPARVCINKWDINPEISERIEAEAKASGIPSIGRIPYDRAFTEAQINGRTLVEESDGPASQAVRAAWEKL